MLGEYAQKLWRIDALTTVGTRDLSFRRFSTKRLFNGFPSL
jgi:hypothetical protein